MRARSTKPLRILVAALVVSALVVMGGTAALAAGANTNAKIAVHIKAHPTSCTKSYPVITTCSQIVSTWAATGDLDAMPVFYDLAQYTVVETGLIWPEAAWYSASWVKCKGDIAIGIIQHTAVPEDPAQTTAQTNGTAIAWSACQTGTAVLPGYAWLAASGPGYVTPSPNPVTGDYGVVDCAPDPGPYYQLPVAVYSAGIGGNTGDNACLAPSCTLNPSSLDFGNVLVGGTSDLTFRLTNTGGGKLVSRPSISGADSAQFAIVAGAGTFALANGQFIDITIRFTPASVGAKSAQVNVATGGCGPVPLAGVGFVAPACQVTPTTLGFGTVNVGSQSDLTFTIKNTGGGTLSGTVSESCPDYQLISGGGAYSLTANQTVTVTVRFAPASAGEKLCTIETGATECVDVLCTGVGQQTIVPLTISKDDGVAATSCVLRGGGVTYSLSYSNPNSSAVTGVVVIDNLPTDVNFVSASNGGSYDPGLNRVTWTIGGLGAGANGSVSVSTTVKGSATPGSSLANECAIVSNEAPTTVTATHSTAVCTCAIGGDEVVCPESHNDFSGPVGMTSYSWTVSGSGTIVGSSVSRMVQVLSGAVCGETYTLTLNLVEPGGIVSSCQKTVTIVDTTLPTITCPSNTSIGCDESSDPGRTGVATAIDNCDLSPAITYSDGRVDGACPQAYIIHRTWTATDGCGNSATCVQTITVMDVVPPLLTCTGDGDFSCEAVGDFGPVTVTDNCDPSPALTFVDHRVDGPCPQAYAINRVWTATDACGNSATCLQTITISDHVAPAITCPSDRSFSCDQTVEFGQAAAIDNCDPSPVIGFSDQVIPGGSDQEYQIVRTWTATDACGNSATCLQTVTVSDTTAPTLVCPGDRTFSCDQTIEFGEATARDNCDPAPGIGHSDNVIRGSCPQQYEIKRTWIATDAAGNSATCIQTVSVVDQTAPVITCAPDARVAHGAPIVFTDPTAADNCDTSPLITVVSTDTTNVPATGETEYTRCWVATDACGNTSNQCCQTIVEEAQAPIEVRIDVRPAGCPNLVNPDFRSPLAIAVLGGAGFDASTINPATLRLHREGVGGEVAPIRSLLEDVATPAIGPLCACNPDGPDGRLDLNSDFSSGAVVRTLDLASARGTQVVLTLTGNLTDGTPITGSDCVFVLRSGNRNEVMLLGSRSIISGGAGFSFSFSLDASDHARAEVFDVHGRLLKVLLERDLAAGSYMVDWDATNGSGSRVPAGIYFVRLTTRTAAQTEKVVVIE